jgi:hypothetical protein
MVPRWSWRYGHLPWTAGPPRRPGERSPTRCGYARPVWSCVPVPPAGTSCSQWTIRQPILMSGYARCVTVPEPVTATRPSEVVERALDKRGDHGDHLVVGGAGERLDPDDVAQQHGAEHLRHDRLQPQA